METVCVLGIEIVIGLILLYTEGIRHRFGKDMPAKPNQAKPDADTAGFGTHRCGTGRQPFAGRWRSFALLFLAAALVRLVAHVICPGHETDSNCFAAWAGKLESGGFAGFYQKEGFADYPPLYLYALWAIGKIKALFAMPADSFWFRLLLKTPAMAADLICGGMIYRLAQKRFGIHHISMVLAAMYLFNPVVILNSSMWGQVDSLLAMLSFILCYAITERRMFPAYLAFGMGVLFKPQMLFLAPVMLAGFVDRTFFHSFTWKKLCREMLKMAAAAVSCIAICLPFRWGEVFSQFMDTVASYPYASVNAFNLWGVFGKCWASQENTFLNLEYKIWGMIFVTLMIAGTLYLLIRFRKEHCRYFLAAAFSVAGIFLFSVRMHERYLFPALLLLLAAFLYKPATEVMYSYILLSALQFCNEAYALYLYDPHNYQPHRIWTAFYSLLTAAACVFYGVYCLVKQGEKADVPVSSCRLLPQNWFGGSGFFKERMASEKHLVFQGKDVAAVIAITAVYACFAMYNLGSTEVPQNAYTYDGYDCDISLMLPGQMEIKGIAFYNGNYEKRKYHVSAYDGELFRGSGGNFTVDKVFAWQTQEVSLTGNRFTIHGLNEKGSIVEMALLDEGGNPVMPLNADSYPELFDEQDLYVADSTFRDSTYFDEIYHARTAYEYIHGLYSYENTHPPLGKTIISIGIRIFGMNPFGWRFMGTLFGILMVPVFYLFARKLLRDTWAAVAATLLFSFDFMHFSQSRIATIDVFATFFIILMYYFMYRYVTMSFYDRPLYKTLIPLGLCGISMGCAIAVKWTGIYASVGLAVLFFTSLYHRCREYGEMEIPARKETGLAKKTLVTLGFCVAAFVVVPGIIYVFSYLPFVNADGDGLVKRALLNQTAMFSYHSGLEDTHAYASKWYTWPVIWKPMWYYAKTLSPTAGEGITAMGNPLVWWGGIPAFFHMAYLWIKKRDRKAGFLLIAYLSQLEPWMFISRTTFIYHYMPSVPFVALMLAYSLYRICLWKKEWRPLLYGYAGAACALFCMYYPVLAGVPVWREYVYTALRWLPKWYFLYN